MSGLARTSDLCEYWVYKAEQADTREDGCFLKLAPSKAAEDTYTAIKLSTGDYAVWPVSEAWYVVKDSLATSHQLHMHGMQHLV